MLRKSYEVATIHPLPRSPCVLMISILRFIINIRNIMTDSIVLLNGNILNCYPIQNYVRPCHWSLSREAIRINKRLFYPNVYNFIANASVGYHTSIGSTIMPCLGIFVEWWKYCNQYSWDADNLPIWAISGNPMTGSHGCATVDTECNIHRAKLQSRFIEIVKSFNCISNRYVEAQKECESYSLDYVLHQLPIKINNN